WPSHSSIALMAFSPSIALPERLTLRDSSKPSRGREAKGPASQIFHMRLPSPCGRGEHKAPDAGTKTLIAEDQVHQRALRALLLIGRLLLLQGRRRREGTGLLDVLLVLRGRGAGHPHLLAR